MIKILIVDDSATETLILKKIFESQTDMHVIGCARNGKEAIEYTQQLKPDVITMDIQMPIMDGFEATRIIMSEYPTPIVVVSAKANDVAMNTTFRAFDVGALAVIPKPSNLIVNKRDGKYLYIIETVRNMSEIKVIKRRSYTKKRKKLLRLASPPNTQNKEFEILAIGASVGGPQALKQIFSQLPADFPLPIVVVQHMTPGFMSSFTTWLNDNTHLEVKEAEQDETIKTGYIYFAPDNTHLEVRRTNKGLGLKLTPGAPVSGFCPSVTVLLQSVAKTCGPNAIGVILTGMGNDGAQGLLEIKKAHGHTFIQDEKSAVVFGMGNVAQSIGAVDTVVELEQIAEYLNKLTAKKIHPA